MEIPRKHMGKVARLPKPVRDAVNHMLLNGATLQAVCDWLATEGHPGFNPENISNWRQGGHQDWLKAQERFENLKLKAEARKAMREQLAAEGLDITDSNTARLMEIADEVLDEFDITALKDVAKNDPSKVFQLLTAATASASAGKVKLAELELKVRRYEDAAREAKAKLEVIKRDGGLSAETLQRIEEAAGLL